MKVALNLELIIRPIQSGEYSALQERTQATLLLHRD